MNKIKEPQEWFSWLPLISDGLAVLLLFTWISWLSPQLATPSGTNVFWLTTHYWFLWVGVWLVRKLETAVSPPPLWGLTFILGDRRVRVGLALLMALLMTSFVAFQFRFFDSIFDPTVQQLHAGETAAFYVFAPSAWLAMALLYVLFLAFPVQPTFATTAPRTAWLMGGALFLINLTCLLFWAQAQALFDKLALPFLLQLALFGLGMLCLFLPPRILYQQKQVNPWPGLFSFAVFSLLLIVWLL